MYHKFKYKLLAIGGQANHDTIYNFLQEDMCRTALTNTHRSLQFHEWIKRSECQLIVLRNLWRERIEQDWMKPTGKHEVCWVELDSFSLENIFKMVLGYAFIW